MLDYDKRTGELWLYDDISDPGMGGIDAGSVKEVLGKLKGDITVRLNSPGGNLTEGIAIYNMLERHNGTVTTVNDSLAASIASVIMMAGDIRLVAQNSLTMIHAPYTIAMGNAEEMRRTADLLDKASDTIKGVYLRRMDVEEPELVDMLDAETWLTANEAVEIGLGTAVGHDVKNVEPVKVAASWYKKTPERLVKQLNAGDNNQFYRRRQHYEHLVQRTKAKYKLTK